MTNDQIQYWQAYVEQLQPIMRLQDWRLTVSKQKADGDAHAAVWMSDDYHEAEIYLGRGWRKFAPEKQRQALAHELVHIHLKKLSRFNKHLSVQLGGQAAGLADDMNAHFLEEATDELAHAIAPFLPLPPSTHDSDDWDQQALAGPRLENTDDDIFATIDISLLGLWERHQKDPILKGDELRLNHHLYAFAVIDALKAAGYQIVPLPPSPEQEAA